MAKSLNQLAFLFTLAACAEWLELEFMFKDFKPGCFGPYPAHIQPYVEAGLCVLFFYWLFVLCHLVTNYFESRRMEVEMSTHVG